MNMQGFSVRSSLERSFVALGATLSLTVLANAAFAAPVPIVATTSSKLVSSLDGKKNPEVFSFTADGHEHQLSWNGSWGAEDIFASTNSIAAPIGTAMTSLKIPPTIAYYLGADGHIHQTLKPSAWTDRDLSQQVGAPVAAANSSLTAILMPDGSSRLYYITTFGNIQEVAVSAGGGTASTANVTGPIGAPVPVSGTALTSFLNGSSGISEPRVYYFSADGHVQELEFGTGGWHYLDITNASGSAAFAAVSGSALTGQPLGNNPRVYYFTSDGHVQELAWGSGWNRTDVTNATGNAAAIAGSALTSELSNGNPRIYYFSYEGHVRELAWGAGWHNGGDVSAKVGAPAAAAGSALTSNYRSGDNVLWLFYITPDNHVQELAWTGGWSHNDINAQR
jgi:hypothetical protein